MRAVVFTDYEAFPKLEEVDRPIPGPGEVLLMVAGAGACHSDVSVYNAPKGSPSALTPPFTLGHENSGWVEEVSPGVSGVPIGDAFLVYGSIGCGHCANCAAGAENYCLHAAKPPLGTGLGYNGGMAEYVAVPARHLVPLGDADPIAAAPLTPYHPIKASLPQLAGGGRYALVIGLGGLGQIAVQILHALTGATILATDLDEGAMRRAEAKGAVTIPGGDDQVAAIREHTGGRGIDAALTSSAQPQRSRWPKRRWRSADDSPSPASPTDRPNGRSSPPHSGRCSPTPTGGRSPTCTRSWRCTAPDRSCPRSSDSTSTTPSMPTTDSKTAR